MYSLPEQIAAVATARGWVPVLAFDNFEANIETGETVYPAGVCVLTYDYTLQPTLVNGRVTAWRGEAMLALGRKAETTTSAEISETHKQKYERRLKYLSEELVAGISDLSCASGHTVALQPIAFQINKFDTNIDFAYTRITLTSK